MKKLINLSLLLFTIHLSLFAIFAQDDQKAELVVQTGHSTDVYFVKFSPDGKNLVSHGDNIKLWDIETGRELKTFSKRYCPKVQRQGAEVVFSSDGKTIATSCSDAVLSDYGMWQTGRI